MGVYFSRHNAREWESTVAEMREFSIWEQVKYSPLSRSRILLLERGTQVEFYFPGGFLHHGDVVNIADGTRVSLLAGVDTGMGHFYAGLLLKAPESSKHKYCREISETTLVASDLGKSTTSLPSIKETEEFTKPRRRKAPPPEPSAPLMLEQMLKEPPRRETPWSYLLLYAVKEGVLAFFSDDLNECEEVVLSVASYGNLLQPEDGGRSGRCTPAMGGRGSPTPMGRSASPSPAPVSCLKVVEHEVAGIGASSIKPLVDCLNADLQRTFAVYPKQEDFPTATNCILLCMRALSVCKIAIRGFDIQRICEEDKGLGPLVGKAAGDAWERIWRKVAT